MLVTTIIRFERGDLNRLPDAGRGRYNAAVSRSQNVLAGAVPPVYKGLNPGLETDIRAVSSRTL
jgi:hypothetical protein